MNIAFCDDDIKIIRRLKKMVKEFFSSKGLRSPQMLEFTSGKDLLNSDTSCDLLFLDIEMPEIDGISVGKEMKKRNPNIMIIIVTSHMEYLDDAMRFHVFRYLSKPIESERVITNLEDSLECYHSLGTEVAVKTKESVYHIHSSDIICVEATERIRIIYTTTGAYDSLQPMDYWKSVLPSNCFFQTNRNFLVNMAYVDNFDKSSVSLNKKQVQAHLTERKYSEFSKAYLLYLESTR